MVGDVKWLFIDKSRKEMEGVFLASDKESRGANIGFGWELLGVEIVAGRENQELELVSD